MRKLFTLISLLIVFCATAQIDDPYKRPELLIGKQVKITPLDIVSREVSHGYEHFYTDEAMNKHYNPIPPHDATKPETLLGRVFTVEDVVKMEGYKDQFRVKIKDDKGETLYTYYIPKHSSIPYNFEVIGGLDVPDDFYCDYVAQETAIHGEGIRYNTTDEFSYDMSVCREKIKVKGKNSEYYGLYLRTMTDIPPMKYKGLTLFLEDGTTIKFPEEKIEIDKWKRYVTYTQLTKVQFDRLQKSALVAYQHGDLKKQKVDILPSLLKGIMKCISLK